MGYLWIKAVRDQSRPSRQNKEREEQMLRSLFQFRYLKPDFKILTQYLP